MWIYYSYQMNDTPMIVRSGTELVLLMSSAIYIIINKLKHLPAHQNSSSSANVIFAASAPTPASA